MLYLRNIQADYSHQRTNMHTTFAFIGGLGGWEVLVIVLVLVIFFGAKRIPELARGLGKGIREFKDATKEIKDEIEEGNRTTTSK